MPFVPVPDTVLAEMRMTQDSQKVENTLYFRGDTLDVGVATTLAENLIAWWAEFYSPRVATAVKLNEVVITDLSSDTGFQVTLAPTVLTTGGITTAEGEPNNVTLAVSFRTASRGRSFRGRNYIVGLTTDQIAQNRMTDEFVTIWQNVYNALLAVATDSAVVWVVVSRFHGVESITHDPIPRITGITTDVTNVVITDNIVDSQRRRLPGRGQ